MTRRRFFAEPSSFTADRQSVRLAPDEARYLRDVLRLQRGDEVYVFDGQGREFHCTVAESSRDFAHLDILAEVEPTNPESPLDLTLAIALLKGEKFDLVVQKTTELGVTRIVPLITSRADVRLRDEKDASKRQVRWQRIALEAAKQSGRARVPDVAQPVAFRTLMTATENQGVKRVMFSERDGGPLAEAIKTGAEAQPIVALVGSEGGWTDEEIALARAAGWEIVTLGGRILRAETAAIAVVALLQNLLGDLN
jgi:16S rRNA (uracil1498-N3)-methyltransferase